MKPLFYLLTAAAHPFGLYVVVPLYMEHCYVVTGSDGAGRAMAAGFAELFAIALWTLGVVIATISCAAVEELNLKVGSDAYAVIKATNVMVGIDE